MFCRLHLTPHLLACATRAAHAHGYAALLAVGVCGGLGAGQGAWAQGMSYGNASSNAGEPSLSMRYVRPLTHSVVMRADVSTSGTPRRSRKSMGLDYAGSLRFDRVAVLADYYVWRQLRVTGGLMVSQVVAASPDARVELRIQPPEVSSYMGLGFGNEANPDLGWNVFGDLGLALGKPATSAQASGSAPLSSGQTADTDKSTQTASGTPVARVRIAPALKLGASLKF